MNYHVMRMLISRRNLVDCRRMVQMRFICLLNLHEPFLLRGVLSPRYKYFSRVASVVQMSSYLCFLRGMWQDPLDCLILWPQDIHLSSSCIFPHISRYLVKAVFVLPWSTWKDRFKLYVRISHKSRIPHIPHWGMSSQIHLVRDVISSILPCQL